MRAGDPLERKGGVSSLLWSKKSGIKGIISHYL